MSGRADHVLLTRFNLPSGGAESYIRARENWLRQRVDLFEKYCLPSVRSQTADIHWIIYLDPLSPDWLVERMQAHARSAVFTPIYRESVSHDELLDDLRRVVPERGPTLITTNLDNDDGLARDFAHRVQTATASSDRQVVYVDQGLILGPSRVYGRRDPHNAFCSVSEPWEAAVTCWSAWHNTLDQQMPAVHLGGRPGWLQVVHEDNVSNRIRGRLVTSRPHRDAFPGLLENLPDPTVGEFVTERAVLGPSRVAREAARGSAKRLLLSLGGRRLLEVVLGIRARRRSPRGSPDPRGC